MGPLGIALTGYQLWRRLSPKQKAAIRSWAGTIVTRMRSAVASRRAVSARATASRVGAATAPQEENPLHEVRPLPK
jgi:hypothetical protein